MKKATMKARIARRGQTVRLASSDPAVHAAISAAVHQCQTWLDTATWADFFQVAGSCRATILEQARPLVKKQREGEFTEQDQLAYDKLNAAYKVIDFFWKETRDASLRARTQRN